MTQEEQSLLLNDLCARLPYGVMFDTPYGPREITSLKCFANEYYYFNYSSGDYNEIYGVELNEIRPYLRPMSSMTEEEKSEFSIFIGKTEVYVQQIRLDADSMANPIIGGNKCVYWGLFDRCIDWLNKKMFDYRGLIPKGLALEAKEGMYKTE